MKKLFAISVICIFATSFGSCKKRTCKDGASPECQETPPTNEMCAAYFERWFYQPSTNTCTMISYSGCSMKGFETQQACESSCVSEE